METGSLMILKQDKGSIVFKDFYFSQLEFFSILYICYIFYQINAETFLSVSSTNVYFLFLMKLDKVIL